MELLTPVEHYFHQRNHLEIELLKMAKDVCGALIFLEQRGIIHGDVKPGNIFRTKTGIFKLGDFSLSVCKHEKVLGFTKKYAPPEIADLKSRIYHPSTDSYGLGKTLEKILEKSEIARKAYSGDVTDVDGNYMDEDITNLHERVFIFRGLRFIIDKACHFDPSKRYSSAGDMLSDLDQLEKKLKGIQRQMPADVGKDIKHPELQDPFGIGKRSETSHMKEADLHKKNSSYLAGKTSGKRAGKRIRDRVLEWLFFTVVLTLLPLIIFWLFRSLFYSSYPYKSKCITELVFLTIILSVISMRDLISSKTFSYNRSFSLLAMFCSILTIVFAAVLYGAMTLYDMRLLDTTWFEEDSLYCFSISVAIFSGIIGLMIQIWEALINE